MKILNLSIQIVNTQKIESTYLSRRSDFVTRLSQLSDFAN